MSEDKVPYDRFQEVVEEKNTYKEKVNELESQIAEMDDVEEIKASYKTKLGKMRSQKNRQRKEFALKETALTEGVRKNALDDVAKVTDMDEISIDDDGNVEGVEEIIGQLKQEKDYLFGESNNPKSAGDDFKDSGESNNDDEVLREAMNL